jgi:hypothetical protein
MLFIYFIDLHDESPVMRKRIIWTRGAAQRTVQIGGAAQRTIHTWGAAQRIV